MGLAYVQGFKAAKAGNDVEDGNPYRFGSRLWHVWRNGWRDTTRQNSRVRQLPIPPGFDVETGDWKRER